MSSTRSMWLELPLVSGSLAGLPATAAAMIFGMAIEKPLTARIAPEYVHLQQTLGSRLELTAPMTAGVALIAVMWIARAPRDWPPRVLLSGFALLATTWLGKVLAFGMAADLHAATGHFVNEGGRLVWQIDPAGVTSELLSGSVWTQGISLLINYYRLYGPEQFFLSLFCGTILGWYWSRRAAPLLNA